MPILIEDLDSFKSRVESYSGIELFYQKIEGKRIEFSIVAGKTCWKGEFEVIEKNHVKALEDWLESEDAVRVSGWLELSELFS